MQVIKRFMFVMVAVMCMMLFAFPTFAATNEQDGVVAILDTEKDSYKSGEIVKAILTIKNTNDYEVTGIKIDSIVPEDYELLEGESFTLNNLLAGKEMSFVIKCQKKDSGNTEIKDEDVPRAVATSTPKPTSSSVKKDSISDRITISNSVKTGDETNLVLIIAIMGVALVGIVVTVILTIKKKSNKVLALLVATILGTALLNSDVVKAEEMCKNFTVKESVMVDNDEIEIAVNIQYNSIAAGVILPEETVEPTCTPEPEVTGIPSEEPTVEPTADSTVEPTVEPTADSTVEPSTEPTDAPYNEEPIYVTTTYAPVTSLDEEEPDVEVYSFEANTNNIALGIEKQVTFTAEIFYNAVIEDDSVLVKDEIGDTVGIMNDNGVNGDEVEGDGIYTLTTTLIQNEECVISYFAIVDDIVSSSFDISYYAGMTDEQEDSMDSAKQAINNLCTSQEYIEATLEEREIMAEQLLNSLAEQGLIEEDSISYSEHSKIFTFKYSSGVIGGIMVGEFSDETNSVVEVSTGGVATDTASTSLAEVSDSNRTTRNAIVFNAFEDTPYRRDFYNELEDDWDDMGLNTEVDIDVTVQDFKNIATSDKDVIVFAMHGSEIIVGSDLISVLCLNEISTTVKDDLYEFELLNESISIISTTEGLVYWVLPDFFERSFSRNAFDDKFFFSESCMFYGCTCRNEGTDSSIADAMVSRSAEAVIGYHNSVGADYSRDVMKMTIEESFEGETIGDALDTAMDEYGEDDDWEDAEEHKFTAFPILTGDDEYVIMEDGIIAGVVLDAKDDTAIGNALIRVYKESGSIIPYRIARTADDGSYYIPSVAPGTYILKINHSSYSALRISITVTPDRVTYTATTLLGNIGLMDFNSVNGFVTSSVTNEGVGNVLINVRRNWNNNDGEILYSTTSNNNGFYQIDYEFGAFTLEVIKDGFITEYVNVYIGFVDEKNIVISPSEINDVYRIVLSWGQNPSDLDSHMVGKDSNGNNFHVYYSSKNKYDNGKLICSLDVDDVTSYGPETITLDANSDTPYYYYVYRYAGSGTVATSNAQVNLYRGEELIETFYVPTDLGSSDYWNIFAIKDGEIIVRNTITSSAETSYAN